MAGIDRRRGVLIMLAGMLALSTDSLFVRWLTLNEPALSRGAIVFWVGALAAVVAVAATAATGGPGPIASLREGGAPLFAAGAAQAGSVAFFVLAVATTTVADVVVVLAAAPLCTALMGLVVLGERPGPAVWTGIALAVAGVVGVALGSVGDAAEGRNPLGVLSAVGAIVSFAAGVTVLRRHAQLRRTMVVAVGGWVLAVAFLPAALVSPVPPGAWVPLVAMGAVLGPLARLLLAVAPRYLPTAEVGLFVPVETVAASLWAYLAFDEVPITTTWVGGAIVIAGVLGAVLVQLRRSDPAPSLAVTGPMGPPDQPTADGAAPDQSAE